MLSMISRAFVLLAVAGLSACASTEAPPSRADTSGAFTDSDFACLREAIYHEAAARSLDGGRAVGNVILNRAEDPRFPNSVCAVVAEGEARGRCQFSYRCDGRPEVYADKVKLANATKAAQITLQKPDEDVTSGALFFHATWMKPGWFATRKRTTTLGGNIFYR